MRGGKDSANGDVQTGRRSEATHRHCRARWSARRTQMGVGTIESGFAVPLARPGRNITGFTLMHTELNGKRLELLHTAFPQITAVGALVDPANAASKLAFEDTETAAR